MNLESIRSHWFAHIYEQEEQEAHIVQYLLRMFGSMPQHILEPACGGGKLCVPLAQAGHHVTGFDVDQDMLYYARQKARHFPHLHLQQADALLSAWGTGYDAVILGANLLLNIVTTWDYKQAQKQLIFRAADALRPGGRLFLDFDCPATLAAFPCNDEHLGLEGIDDRGVYGQYFIRNTSADEHTRIVKGTRRYVLTLPGQSPAELALESVKHFPTLEEVCSWLYRAGLSVTSLYGGYQNEPFDTQHQRAVIIAKKQ